MRGKVVVWIVLAAILGLILTPCLIIVSANEEVQPTLVTIETQEVEIASEIFELKPVSETEPALSEEELKWQVRAEEYPIATQVWLYMKQNFGWSDIVCAGIMGNIMAEIGGGTLEFDNWNHNAPYGMFQWLGQRKIDIKQKYGAEPNIFEQLDFMYDELYGTDGVRKQVSETQRDKILNATTEEDVATYFCIYFERPGNSGKIRRTYAHYAYEYFTD